MVWRRGCAIVDERGHKDVPADIFVPRESERPAWREVDEAGHKTGPAACSVPAESEPHASGEVDCDEK